MKRNPEARPDGRNLVEIKKIADHLSDFTRDKRILLLAAMAIPIGAISTVVAYALLWLIGAITNLAFFSAPLARAHRAGGKPVGASGRHIDVATVVEQFAHDDPWLFTRHHAALIVDGAGRLAGIITQGGYGQGLAQ